MRMFEFLAAAFYAPLIVWAFHPDMISDNVRYYVPSLGVYFSPYAFIHSPAWIIIGIVLSLSFYARGEIRRRKKNEVLESS